MSMVSIENGVESLMLTVTQEVLVHASLEDTFESILMQMGPENCQGDGQAMPMKLEAWPGGRWYRDLGDNNGHFWGVVQAIKRPTLLEIHGPLFMSYGAISNVQYRLSEAEGGTLIRFHHKAIGMIDDQHRQNVGKGWNGLLVRIREHAQTRGR